MDCVDPVSDDFVDMLELEARKKVEAYSYAEAAMNKKLLSDSMAYNKKNNPTTTRVLVNGKWVRFRGKERIIK
jgi:hypothetical protein